MRLAGQMQAAIEVLADVEGHHRPIAAALKDWGVAHRFAGSGDRATIGNLVYDAMRGRLAHAYRMDDDSPRAAILSTVASDWNVSIVELERHLADSGGHGPAPLTEDERARLALPLDEGAPAPVRANLPEWLFPTLEAVFGGNLIAEGAALARRPPLDLRVNTLKTTREKAAMQLARLGAVPTPLSPVGLRIPPAEGARRHPNVTAEEAYGRGRVEVQDEGSQIAALMTGARAGEQVLDYCAGAGGKTLALAAMMENRGQIHAHDADRARLAPLYERLKRADIRNVQTVAPAGLDPLARRMDLVVVDAPCSGSGTWRRRPDTKWRLTPESLARRIVEQDAVLAEAVRFVKPGGRLAYITCSMLLEENDARVAAFLSAQSDFARLDANEAFREVTGKAARPLRFGVQMSPHTTDTDAFYVALLARTA